MNKIYLSLLIVLFVAGGSWFVMNRPSVSTSKDDGSQTVAQPTEEPKVQETQMITLTVISPASNAIVKTNKVTVSGNTSAFAEVFINDIETKADASGDFSAVVTLDEGENPIIIVANDANGNTAEQEIMVTSETF